MNQVISKDDKATGRKSDREKEKMWRRDEKIAPGFSLVYKEITPKEVRTETQYNNLIQLWTARPTIGREMGRLGERA